MGAGVDETRSLVRNRGLFYVGNAAAVLEGFREDGSLGDIGPPDYLVSRVCRSPAVCDKKLRYLKSSVTEAKTWIALVLSSLIISGNWLIYIWAVNIGHVMETSLGYYINPLLSVLFGVLFLKERMRLGQWIAIVLAAIGVSVMTFHYGKVPWVAILLALTFALYGLAKKPSNSSP